MLGRTLFLGAEISDLFAESGVASENNSRGQAACG